MPSEARPIADISSALDITLNKPNTAYRHLALLINNLLCYILPYNVKHNILTKNKHSFIKKKVSFKITRSIKKFSFFLLIVVENSNAFIFGVKKL